MGMSYRHSSDWPMATIEHDMADRLLKRLDWMRLSPQRILNSSVDGEYIARRLCKRYPEAQIQHSVGEWPPDTTLPWPAQTFDLIFSHLHLHQSEDWMATLQTWEHLLAPNGLLLLTTLGPDTLRELRMSSVLANTTWRTEAFVDMHDVGDALLHSQLLDPVMDREQVTVRYSSLNALLEDLHGFMGQRNVILTPVDYEALQDASEERVSITLELIYGHAWARSVRTNDLAPGEAVIVMDSISLRKN